MIIKTKIEWNQTKELTESEKELREAKKSVLKDYDPTNEDEYETVIKRAIIDTKDDKLYVEISENKICLTNLMNGEYMVFDDSIQKVSNRIYFEATLDEIMEKLTN